MERCYRVELKRKLQTLPLNQINEIEVKELQQKKSGRPYLLGHALEKHVQKYILFLREKGAVVSTDVVSCAQGIVKNEDCCLLDSNGGPITLGKAWVKSLLCRMGFVKCRASTSANVQLWRIINAVFTWYCDQCLNGWNTRSNDNKLGPNGY